MNDNYEKELLHSLLLQGNHEEIKKRIDPESIAKNIRMRSQENEKDKFKLLILEKSASIHKD